MKNKIFLPFILVVLGFQLKSFAQNTEVFQVDFALWGSVYADWNKTDNVNPNTGALVLPGPIQTLSGLDLPISISLESRFAGSNYSGMTSGIYPSNVMKRGYYVETEEGILKISGLDLSKKYTITCFGSKSAYGNENYTTVYSDVTDGAVSVSASLNAYQNTSNTVDLEDLVPNSSGEILLSVTKDENAISGYINAIVVTITDNVSTPKPDLAIISSTIDPPGVRPDEEIQIETTVQNIGETHADATNLRYYLSDDGVLDASDVLLEESLIKDATTGLSQGESITVQATVQIPTGTFIGDKYMIQIVDQDIALSESELDNNEDVQNISILEPPTTRYVAVDGSDETGDGSIGNPFMTIQHGINQINPDDTLYIREGMYIINDSLVLKSRICIKGEDRDKTYIRRYSDSGYPYGNAVFYGEDIANIYLYDLKISSGGDGIAFNSCDHIKMEGVTLLSSGSGIVFNDVSNAELVNNTIRTGVSGAEFGLKSSGQSGFFIIKNNIISDFEYCVYFDNLQCTPEISYNDVFSGGGINYSGIPDPTGVTGNISVDPKYFDFYAPNAFLNAASPCINAGDPSSPLDSDGTRADIGAIPYYPITPLELDYASINVSCFGGDDGMIDATVNGGLPPYNLFWSNGATTEDQSNLMAGTYYLTVEDRVYQYSYIQVDITEPTELQLSLEQADGECSGGLLSIMITVAGGTVPYTYQVDDGNIETISEATITVPAAEGSHIVTIIDANNCSISEYIDLSNSVADTPEICVITVDDATGSLKVNWLPQEGIELNNIYRESNETDIYELIGTVSSWAGSFVDVNADPDIRSYRYKISALDQCGGETELSAHHKSMHLTVNVGLNDEVNLIWDDYEGFDYSSYNIQRGPSPENISEHLATVPANIHSYTDLFSSVSSSYYRIEVVSNNICGTPSSGRITEKPVSRSNVASREDAVTSYNDHVLDGIKIFPNPADGFIHINVPEDLGILKELTIRNLTGKLMEHKTFHLREENSIDIGNLHSGVYILTLDLSNTKSFNKKVFINH